MPSLQPLKEKYKSMLAHFSLKIYSEIQVARVYLAYIKPSEILDLCCTNQF